MCIFYIRLPNSTNCVKFFPNQFQQMKLVNNLFQQRLSMDLSSSMACIHLPLGSCDTFCTSIVHYKLTQNHQCGNHLNYNSRQTVCVCDVCELCYCFWARWVFSCRSIYRVLFPYWCLTQFVWGQFKSLTSTFILNKLKFMIPF